MFCCVHSRLPERAWGTQGIYHGVTAVFNSFNHIVFRSPRSRNNYIPMDSLLTSKSGFTFVDSQHHNLTGILKRRKIKLVQVEVVNCFLQIH